MQPNSSSSGESDDNKRYLRRIIVFGLMIHIFLVLNDGVFHDHWIFWLLRVTGDWESFKRIWVDIGLAHLNYFYYPLYRYTDPHLVGRILIALSIVLTACSLYVICKNNLKIPAWESWAIAMLTVSYPIYNVHAPGNIVHYAIPYAFLCLGWVWYLNLKPEEKLFKYGLIYTLWALSLYTYNSLLSIFFGFVLVQWYAFSAQEESGDETKKWTCSRFLKLHWFLVSFPFIVYLFKRTFGKPGGWYAGYNEIVFLKSSLIEGIGVFFHVFQRNLIGTVKELIRIPAQLLFPSFWIVFLSLLVILFVANKRFKFLGTPSNSSDWLNSRIFWICGVFVILAIVPYAMVGKYVYDAIGFRHALTLGFPLSLGLVLLVSYLQKKFQKWAQNFALYCCVTVILLGGFGCAYKYCQWQERWVVDRATIETLKTITPPKAGTILYYENPFYRKMEKKDVYRSYELSGILYYGWGGSQWLGIHNLKPPNEKAIDASLDWAKSFDNEFRARNGLVDFKPNGCASTFNIIPTDQGEKGWLSLKYWWYRFVRNEGMEKFLKSILTVEIRPIPYKNCF